MREALDNAARNGEPVKRRKQLRNQISAAEARVRQKRESMFLNRVTRDKDEKILKLLTFLGNNMSLEQLIKMQEELANDWDLDKSDIFC